MEICLELEDSGFDFSVLSELRSRLVAGNAEQLICEKMLDYLKQKGLLKAGGRQRTDATHVLAAVRALNRVVLVGERLRAALNGLAVVVPEWLKRIAKEDWYDRYERKFEEYRLPKEKGERTTLVETIGADGYYLLQTIFRLQEQAWLRKTGYRGMSKTYLQHLISATGLNILR